MRDKDPAHIVYAHEIRKAVIPWIEKEFALLCNGAGGSMPYDVNSISLSFHADRRSTVEEARELLVRCTEKCLKMFNASEKIRPYLAEFPFPPARVHISISFWGNEYGHSADGTVSHVYQVHNQIAYFLEHPTQRFHTPFFVEPYDKALAIVQASPKTNADLRIHHGQPYENALDVVFAAAGKAIDKKWKVQLVQSGGDLSNGIKEFAFLFYKYKKVDVKEARQLEVGIMEILLEQINANIQLRPYLKMYPVKPEHLKVLLEFKDSKGFDQDGEDRLCSVRHENNVFQYCMLESMDKEVWCTKPIIVREESYEDAVELVKGKKSTPL